MTELEDLKEYSLVSRWSILTGYVGSISHGTYSPSEYSIDDKDIMSIIVPPVEYYYGLRHLGRRGTKVIQKYEWDIVCYEVLKFIRLLVKANPNVLGLLYLPDDMYIHMSPAGELLKKYRALFATKKAYQSFTGYAAGQLHRMTHNACQGYMGKKRKELVEKFGYDTKNASHLIRLLRMGIEFLSDGIMYVHRADAQQLIEIKQGAWTLEQVKKEAEALFKAAEVAYNKSPLREEPDMSQINYLCVEVIRSAHAHSGGRTTHGAMYPEAP